MNVILSAAVSLDGYLDDLSPRRLKLSSPEDWAAVTRLRAECDAILVGGETVRRDNPSLIIRDKELRRQRIEAGMDADIVKVAVSGSGRLDPAAKFFAEGAGRKIVFTSMPAPQLATLAEVVVCREITAATICRELEARGIRTLMVEGGSRILSMFLREGMADRFRLAIAPVVVGEGGAPRLMGEGVYPWEQDRRMAPQSVEILGDTTVMHLLPGREVTDDERYMTMAVAEAFKCAPSDSSYCVGAVIVTPAGEVFTGYTGETGLHNHAEEEAIAKALSAKATLKDATIYSSMEPCSTRSSKPLSCTALITGHEFSKVVYAQAEPPNFVTCHGHELLDMAGVEVVVLEAFAPQVLAANVHLTGRK